MTRHGVTLVDSDVFSLLYVRRASMDARVAGWQEYLGGRRVLVSFQTHAGIGGRIRCRVGLASPR